VEALQSLYRGTTATWWWTGEHDFSKARRKTQMPDVFAASRLAFAGIVPYESDYTSAQLKRMCFCGDRNDVAPKRQ
jgi:hypothetical protein